MYVNEFTIRVLLPEILLVILASWIYIGGTIQRSRLWWTVFALAGYGIAAFALTGSTLENVREVGSTGPLALDYLGDTFRWVALLVGVLLTLAASRSAVQELATEFIATLMLMIVGVMLVARANELVFLFVSLELISIPTYVLLYLGRRDGTNSEAAVKYFLLSLLSSALLLYGLSFLYGMSGTTLIDGEVSIRAALSETASGTNVGALAPIALVMIVAGLGFKITAVPFHFYAPDVYQGTSNANVALLAVVPKLAGVVAIVRLVVIAMPSVAPLAWQLLLIISLLTMTLGNVCALWQKNVRRLLAYSSIAHGGYLLIGLVVALAATSSGVGGAGGLTGTLFYLFVYSIGSLGAFSALAYLSSEQREVSSLDDLSGLSQTQPFVAAVIAICMFSLAGIPPLAGFWGKLTLFTGAIQLATSLGEGPVASWLMILAIAGAVNAAIAAAYYLRVVALMYFQPSSTSLPSGGAGTWLAMAASGVLVVALGIAPRQLMDASRQADISTPREAAAVGSIEPETQVGQVAARQD